MGMSIKGLIKEEIELLLEKRIAQISANVEVSFGFDIIKTKHAEKRKDFNKRGLTQSSLKPITNLEMSEFVRGFRDRIAEGIALGDIVDQTEFVLKSLPKRLSMAIIAEHVSGTYWKLIIKTVFRESELDSFRVGSNQLVYEE